MKKRSERPKIWQSRERVNTGTGGNVQEDKEEFN
jgi:hypothetical protein